MESHHTTLAKDYIIVKLIEGVDENVAEVTDRMRTKEEGGIPWQAITEPDGKVLTTSDGPLGNIGMPGSDEDLRHFRRMLDLTAQRLKSDERDSLIKSLSPNQ